jgi:hypothetical protein
MVTIIATGFEQSTNTQHTVTSEKNVIPQKSEHVAVQELQVHAAHKVEEEKTQTLSAQKTEQSKNTVPFNASEQQDDLFLSSDDLDIPTFLRNKHNSEQSNK